MVDLTDWSRTDTTGMCDGEDGWAHYHLSRIDDRTWRATTRVTWNGGPLGGLGGAAEEIVHLVGDDDAAMEANFEAQEIELRCRLEDAAHADAERHLA